MVNQADAQAALDEEERQRQAVIKKRAEQLGDAHWVLDAAKLPKIRQAGTPLRVVQVGFSQIDGGQSRGDEEEEDDAPQTDGPAFRSYGPEKRKKEAKACTSGPARMITSADTFLQSRSESDSDSDSESDSEDSDSSDSSSEESDAEGDASQNKPGRASYGSQKRVEIRSRKKAEREKATQLAAKRRTKEVQLNKLTSISGAGSFSSKGSNSAGRRR